MSETRARAAYLPDFCSLEAIFPVVVIGELLAFVLVLRPGSGMVEPWRDLALTSLFIQWVALTAAGTLCVLRRALQVLPPTLAAASAWLAVVCIVALLSELAYWTVDLGWLGDVDVDSPLLSDTVFWLTQQPLLPLDLRSARHLDFLIRTTTIGAIVGAVALRYMHVQFQWKRNLESEANARIAALQARIRPHFLFNSMNTIVSFTRTRPELAEQVVEDLSDLFRASLGDGDGRAGLASELDIARGYLRIEGLRLGARLRVDWQVDTLPGDALLPQLSLQPLVENAVYHGVERLGEGGTVRVAGEFDGEHVTIRVRNPVPADGDDRPGSRVAQASVRERLAHLFGDQAAFAVAAADGHYEVVVTVPYRRYTT